MSCSVNWITVKACSIILAVYQRCYKDINNETRELLNGVYMSPSNLTGLVIIEACMSKERSLNVYSESQLYLNNKRILTLSWTGRSLWTWRWRVHFFTRRNNLENETRLRLIGKWEILCQFTWRLQTQYNIIVVLLLVVFGLLPKGVILTFPCQQIGQLQIFQCFGKTERTLSVAVIRR
jgi:hypothetical protein